MGGVVGNWKKEAPNRPAAAITTDFMAYLPEYRCNLGTG
jgi:hypothetical protein